ncbi:MAG: YihY/virulence factor BrkB family protein [Proteobacteria bacterium]|nr:YihY/virulence factor BrkB family protein [Pseudomonadota bacterium]
MPCGSTCSAPSCWCSRRRACSSSSSPPARGTASPANPSTRSDGAVHRRSITAAEALSVVPIFLVWMYLSWAVILFGAVLTASLADRRTGGPPDRG